MKFYSLDTEFTFGKFQGKTMTDILNEDLSYLDWCLINLDHFCISSETLDSIRRIKPNFSLSETAENKRLEKIQTWESEQKTEDEYYDFEDNDDYHQHYSQEDLEMGDWDYDPMNPAHNPSENPWIDVFGPGDEAETAYWNTD
jgi:hypothetical protein